MRERLNRVQAGGVALAVAAVFVASYGRDLVRARRAAALHTSWMGFTLIAVMFWGLTGNTQKLATNHVSAELSLLGFAAGFLTLTAFVLLFTDTPFTFGSRG
jgi:drug/metabolite transporter (DMT)-like permease